MENYGKILADSVEDIEENKGVRLPSQIAKTFTPLAVSIMAGYLVAPYTSTITRYCYPYFYAGIRGNMPEDLSYLEYGGVYLPLREHTVNFAYQNSYAICMTAGVFICGISKLSYHVAQQAVSSGSKMISSIGSSLHSFFYIQSDDKSHNDKEDAHIVNTPQITLT